MKQWLLSALASIGGGPVAQDTPATTEHDLRLIVKNIPGFVIVTSATFEIEYVNCQMQEYLGASLDEVMKWKASGFVHPDDFERVDEVLTNASGTGDLFEIENRLRRFDGVFRWFHARGRPLKDADGSIVRWYWLMSDIEDRKKADNVLRESARNLKLIADTIPVLAWSARVDGTVDFFNQHYIDYVGLTSAQMQDGGWSAAAHPDDREVILEEWQDALKSGRPAEVEARLRRYDGEYRRLLMRASPLRNEDGKIIRWYGTNTDIEDRKRAEEAVAASDHNFKLIIDTIPALVWSARLDGSMEFFNQHYIEYVGLPSNKLQDWGWTGAVHPDDLKRLAEMWEAIMASGDAGEAEGRLRRADGEYRWFLFRVNPLRNESGIIIKWYGIAADIEDRKRVEYELRRSEAFLAEGQRLSQTGTFQWNVDTKEYAASDELCRIFELDPALPMGLHRTLPVIHPDDLHILTTRIDYVQKGGGDDLYQFRLRMTDGRVKYLRCYSHVIKHADGHRECVGGVQDETDRHHAEEALGQLRSALSHMSRVASLGALTASIAHEVNQPLAGIVTNASTCLRMLAANPPNVEGAQETARRTIRDGNRAADVITRLRALFTKKEPVVEEVDINDATKEVMALVSSDLQRNRVIVRAELSEIPLRVTGDRIQLQQVLLNLVRNASDAMSDVNGHSRHLLIKTYAESDEWAHISVKDAGGGFDLESVEQMFDPFYTTKSEGMGIGLSVSRSIIESHGGKLWAELNDGPGATFMFSVPRQQSTGRGHGEAVGVTPINRVGASGSVMRN